MPQVVLTDLFIQRIQSSDNYITYLDVGLPNFGVRVGKRSRTFVVLKGNERKRISIGRYPGITLKDARNRAKIILSGAQPAQDASDAPPMANALDGFLHAHAAKTRPGTQRETARILRRLQPLAATSIDRITTDDLVRIIDPLAKQKPAEANATHAKFNLFFNWCVRRQILERNPLAIVPRPALVSQRERVLSDDELAAVLKAALSIINTPYGAIVIIIAFTGLRRNEVHTLCWSRIDNYTIRIPKEIAKNHIELVLPNPVLGYLARIPKTHDRLFPDNVRWHESLQLLHQRSNTSNWSLHDLRRTLSTNMSRWEIAPIDVVEAILNHVTGSRSQIQRTYDRASRLPQMRRALSAYADRLHALMKTQ